MKHNPFVISVLALAVFFSVSGVVFAQSTDGSQTQGMMGPRHPGEGRPGGMIAPFPGGNGTTTGMHDGPGRRGPGPMGSTTWQNGERMGERHSSTTDTMHGPMMRGIPGVVTEVGSGSFLIASRGLGRGTTTLTVTVSDTTMYLHGSSTASFSDLSAGAKVIVFGKVATSTKTITAIRVQIGNDKGEGMKAGMRDEGGQGEQVQQGGGHPDFLSKFKKFFRMGGQSGGGQSSGDTSGGPAAAGASGDFMNEVLSSLFGWMHQ